MASKIRSLALMLLVVMLFSGVVHGKPLPEGITVDGIYYGKGYDPGNPTPNLFIGGISQKSPNPDDNPDNEKIADDNQAIYVPTYYSGSISLEHTKKDAMEVNKAALGVKTDYNGLNLQALNGRRYGTIIAYSGGTATAVTALAQQGVTCDTLILISPMAAGLHDAESKLDPYLTAEKTNLVNLAGTGTQSYLEANKAQAEADKIHEEAKQEAKQTAQKGFEAQINAILSGGDSAHVHKIIVVQSVDDKPPLGDVFQYRFPKDNGPKPITVHDVKLGGISGIGGIVGGIAGHVDILTYAEKNIINSPDAAVAGATNIGTQPQEPVAPAPQSYGNSVVGKWNVHLPGGTDLFIFNMDGTYSEEGQCPGTWVQNGNTIQWQRDFNCERGNHPTLICVGHFEGTITGDTMSGTTTCPGGSTWVGSWSAVRA